MNIKRSLSSLALLGGALAGSLTGCAPPKHITVYEGYNVRMDRGKSVTSLVINDEHGFLEAIDYNNDGRYERINLSNDLPLGHPFEKYANIQSMKEINDKVLSEVKLEASQ